MKKSSVYEKLLKEYKKAIEQGCKSPYDVAEVPFEVLKDAVKYFAPACRLTSLKSKPWRWAIEAVKRDSFASYDVFKYAVVRNGTMYATNTHIAVRAVVNEPLGPKDGLEDGCYVRAKKGTPMLVPDDGDVSKRVPDMITRVFDDLDLKEYEPAEMTGRFARESGDFVRKLSSEHANVIVSEEYYTLLTAPPGAEVYIHKSDVKSPVYVKTQIGTALMMPLTGVSESDLTEV